MRIYLSSLVFLLLLSQAIFAFSIIQKPILFNHTRIELTQEYQTHHYGITPDSIRILPKIIVLHWTETATLSEAFNIFNPVRLSSRRSELSQRLNVSAHFLVDRNGAIYQFMSDKWMARHVIGLNPYAIGIENVGGLHQRPNLTKAQAQAQANIHLIAYLKVKYPSIDYLIGHRDYLKFKKTKLWLEKDSTYETKKKIQALYLFVKWL